MRMKFVLMLLTTGFIVNAHQYFHGELMGIPWLPYFVPHPFINKEQPVFMFYPRALPQRIYSSQNEDFNNTGLTPMDDVTIHPRKDEQYPDAQLRVKGFQRDQHPHLNTQEDARFLYNFLASTATYMNRFLKTATFTSTLALAVTSIVSCVPANQVLNGVAATACRRRREAIDSSSVGMFEKFTISPSEPYRLTSTTVESSFGSLNQISSSKDEPPIIDLPSEKIHAIEKRFLFLNKNQFVVPTTITTFLVTNVTRTVTVNLLNPLPVGDCEPVDLAANTPQCVACLPSGYVVCAANG
ncbi:hypothetical protein GHT06_016048 [Daphnia sinensis]|uniref:Uncharacterized protein n=1 Tax=Daphnia sinensis TaxID=1820382 RepID=A0AAD5PWU3_9CRUS|nr:hypothetical protein GHT06_016048 [Daphnia sinensis]